MVKGNGAKGPLFSWMSINACVFCRREHSRLCRARLGALRFWLLGVSAHFGEHLRSARWFTGTTVGGVQKVGPVHGWVAGWTHSDWAATVA